MCIDLGEVHTFGKVGFIAGSRKGGSHGVHEKEG